MKARRILFSVAAFAAMLLIWEFAVRSFDFAEYMLPPPSEVAMDRDDIVERADLEEQTVDEVLAILAAEFEDDEKE